MQFSNSHNVLRSQRPNKNVWHKQIYGTLTQQQ